MSARAVGGAVGRNPISILVPCHRVVGASGSLTGYAGGLDRKVKLLTLERTDMQGLFIPRREPLYENGGKNVMTEYYNVERIWEDDFGCEERPAEYEPQVIVVLKGRWPERNIPLKQADACCISR